MNGFSLVFVLKMKCASKLDPDGPREKLRELPKIDVLALLLGLLPRTTSPEHSRQSPGVVLAACLTRGGRRGSLHGIGKTWQHQQRRLQPQGSLACLLMMVTAPLELPASVTEKGARSSGHSLAGVQVTKGITQSHSTIESQCTHDGQSALSRRC